MFISSDPDICPISSYLLSSKIDGSEPLDDKAEEIFSLDEETVTLVASTEVIGNYRFFLLALSESERNQSLAINVIFTVLTKITQLSRFQKRLHTLVMKTLMLWKSLLKR